MTFDDVECDAEDAGSDVVWCPVVVTLVLVWCPGGEVMLGMVWCCGGAGYGGMWW